MTEPVGNFYKPILNVVYPAVINDAVLGQEYTRVLSVTQTASFSHVNNLQVTVNCADKTAFGIVKIEVGSDNSTWTDITASALDVSQAGKYVYKITRENTFTPLAYAGQQLQSGSTVYIRETVKVLKCSGGSANYAVAYGDGNTFCAPASTAQVNINALTPAYAVDFEYTGIAYQNNINYNQAGRFDTKISNKSTNSEAWMLKNFVSVYDTRYATGMPPHRFDSVALMKADGATILCEMPISNNIAMQSHLFTNPGSSFNLSAHSYMHKIDLEQLPKATTQQMKDDYTAAGLSDTDGDNIYSDILPGKTVTLRIYYHFYIEDNIVDCNTIRLFENNIRADVFWKDRCEQTWSYSRTENSTNSTNFRTIRGGMNNPVTTVDNYLLAAGETATLTVMMQNAQTSEGQRGYPYKDIGNTRIHKVEITMPDGLDYNTPLPVKIRNETETAGIDVTAANTDWSPSTGVLTFRNTKSLIPPVYYDIPVIATGTTDNTKSIHIEHTFKELDMPTGPHRWSCWDATVPYIQKSTCTGLEMTEFTAERTSFGWEDPSGTNRVVDTLATARANRDTPGIDLHAVGPYDNITFVNKIAVNSNISLNSNDNVMVELTYSAPYAGALFDMPATDVSRKIVLYYKASGVSWTTVTTIPYNSPLITSVNTNPDHTLGVNITSLIGSGAGQIPLNAGDSLMVEYLLQTTTNIPREYPALVSVQAEVYIKNGMTKQACYPRLQTIKTFNYILHQISSPSDDYVNVNVTDDYACFFRWELSNGAGGVDEVFPKEYRPNALIKNMTFTIDALVSINSLYWSRRFGTYHDYDMMMTNDYTVSYDNGSTIITIHTHPLMREVYENYAYGWWVYGSYDIICVDPNKTSITSSSSFQRLDYPTSATTANYRSQTGNTTTRRPDYLTSARHYQTSVTTPQALKTTSTPVITWDFNVNNASVFASSDPVLPNSWIAFECDAGVIPYELYDNQSSTTITIDNSHQYAANKWWVKLGDLNIPTSRSYTIKCTYTACSGQPGMKIIHGFARLAYPTDPQQGFTDYNSPGYVCNAKSVTVMMTPPAADFSGVLTHRPGPSTQHIADGTNAFCDTVGFRAEFHNGLLAEVSDLRLRVTLPAGFDYDGTIPAEVKFGNGAWETLPSGNVVQSDGYLNVTLSSTNQVLSAYGTAGASAYVDFRLKISCGAENKQQIYADFIGKSGCGASVTKTYNSSQIKIAGTAAMADYWVEDLSAAPTPVYTNASSPTDGSFTITGKYIRAANAGGDDILAIIELPDNLNLTSTNSGLNFVQSGTRLTATLPASDNMGDARPFDLTFTPVNPALWSEDTVKINFYTGQENDMSCGSVPCAVLNRSDVLNSMKFAMKKLDIRYSDSIAARSHIATDVTEEMEIKGWLVNKELTVAFDAGKLTMELWYRNNGLSWSQAGVSVSGLTVDAVLHGDSTQFTVEARLPEAAGDECDLRLVLRRTTGASESNPYLAADSVAVEVSLPRYARNDLYTVQKYGWTEIDVLDNDVLPGALFTPDPSGRPFSLLESVEQKPRAGTLSVTGTGRNSRLIYLNSGTDGLTDHIDSLVYRFRYDPGTGVVREFRATVYIYILDELHGASACRDSTFTATLRERPKGVSFWWYTADTVWQASGVQYTFGALSGDSVRWVKPIIPEDFEVFKDFHLSGGFPPGLLTIHADTAATPRPMRWTGLINTDWHNPANWVETVRDDATGQMLYETPVSWSPAPCTDVVIPSDLPRYPELTDSAWCNLITVQDRAMLANPHALIYDSAQVELKLKSTERDRFVMWSAPLKDMYSGDYHFKDNIGEPRWGDVSMNYFQLAHPAGNAAQADMFTATFGHPGDSLLPGKAFNVKLTSTSFSRDVTWIFPQSDKTYSPGGGHPSVSVAKRDFAHRFITDGMTPDTATGRFLMPVRNDVANGRLVQIVNPYLAWLRVDSFLQESDHNKSRLASSGFLMWDGDMNKSFIAVRFKGDSMRYEVTDPTLLSLSPANLVAPLQSFFVAKEYPSVQISSVEMSARWTTTAPAGGGYGGYTLRAVESESGLLRIRATQGNGTSYAALSYDRNASPEYRGSEDVRCLFYDGSPLTLYALTALDEPLSIYTDGTFDRHTTALGLRLAEAGQITLSFTGMESFGHNVYLIDLERNSLEIDLQATPEYTFTAVRPPGAGAVEINDRFVLRMEYTGRGLVSVSVPDAPEIRCHGLDGHIHVHAVRGTIHRLEVYGMTGRLMYAGGTGRTTHHIPAPAGIYFVKALTGEGTVHTEKVVVR
ncbi:MAG: T9SS type A sorting domain-containing protein [Tannerella sp.]|nr:T9SS type A sorting domain-containing protein [Tannerella sp.]